MTLRYPAGTPYVCPRGSGAPNILLEESGQWLLSASIAQIVAVESPIHLDVLTTRLREHHGVSRAGNNIKNNVANAVRLCAGANQVIRDRQNVLWQPGQSLASFRVPTSDRDRRAIQHIPAAELQLAILHTVEVRPGVFHDAVAPEVARLLGYQRMSEAISGAIANQVNALVQQRKLRLNGPRVELP